MPDRRSDLRASPCLPPGSPCRSMPGKASACAGAPAGCCRPPARQPAPSTARSRRFRCWCSAIPRPLRSASSSPENGLAAQLAALLAASTARAVRWRAAGFNSATSGQLRDHVVPNLAADPWTHIVLAVGTNDIKNFHSLPRFKKEFGGLLYALRAKWPEARIVWQPVIALTDVPALPSALARLLETRAGAINALGDQALPRTRRTAGDAARRHRRDRRLFERRLPRLRGRLSGLGRASAAVRARRALSLRPGSGRG